MGGKKEAELEDRAFKVRELYKELKTCVLDKVLAIAEELAAARGLLKAAPGSNDGCFHQWIRDHCEMAVNTAQRMLQVREAVLEDPSRREFLSYCGLDALFNLCAAKRRDQLNDIAKKVGKTHVSRKMAQELCGLSHQSDIRVTMPRNVSRAMAGALALCLGRIQAALTRKIGPNRAEAINAIDSYLDELKERRDKESRRSTANA